MSNIINKIKNLTLLEFNKSLLLLAIFSLIYRNGSFTDSYSNPFEIIFVLLFILTFIDIIKNNKIKEFWLAVPRKIWIASFCLLASVLLGWIIAIFIINIPQTFNNILEFGGFAIGLATFFLVLFYIKNDEVYAKKCLYALLISLVYIYAISPQVANYFHLVDGTAFVGFTINQNIVSKVLLIPILFFTTYTLFEERSKSLKLIYFIISVALVSLLFWTGSRGALLAMALSFMFVCLIFILHNFHWEKIFAGGGLVFIIIICGYLITPSYAQTSFFERNLSFNKITVMKNLIFGNNIYQDKTSKDYVLTETRLKLWPMYTKEVIKNPFGFGPNTHMDMTMLNGEYIMIGPHNTYIEILFWGGVLGLFSFLYILLSAFKNLKIKLQTNFNPITVALLAILLALSIALSFNDSLQFFWFWIILALATRR